MPQFLYYPPSSIVPQVGALYVILETVGALGNILQTGPHPALRIVEHFPDVLSKCVRLITGGQILESLSAHVVAGHLGVEVTLHLNAGAHILSDEGHEFFVQDPLLYDLDGGDLQPVLCQNSAGCKHSSFPQPRSGEPIQQSMVLKSF